MQYVKLGRTGLKVSRIGLGTMMFGSRSWRDSQGVTRDWLLEEDEARPIFRRAMELGINFFDTADAYSQGLTEEIVGRALKDVFTCRDEFVLTTKVYHAMGDKPNQGGLSRKHILHAIDASLSRLGLDHVDIYQIHWWDGGTPFEETLEALHDVVRAGKARYVGASNLFAWQLAKALFTADLHAWPRFVSLQNQYNIIYREDEREIIPLCLDQGVGVIPWSPLARGFVMGNRAPDKTGGTARARGDAVARSMYYQEADFAIAERVGEVAEQLGASRAQVALAWILQKPGVTSPIVGTGKIGQLEDVVRGLDLTLTTEQIARLEEPYRPKRILRM
ncbi:MAG: aldo/keto reductase [Bryobacteraceae bacterium]